MDINNDLEALAMFDRYKWDETFVCYKCGFKKFKKGKSLYSRRCSKCDYDESVFKFSAFEDSRISPKVLYGILEYISKYSYLDGSLKVIPKRLTKADTHDEFGEIDWDDKNRKFTSLDEMTDKFIKNNYQNPEIFERKILKAIAQYQPTVKKIATKFNIEENSVASLMERIADRFREQDNYGADTALGVIVSYLKKPDEREKLDWLLGITMIPMRGKWEYGVRQINKQWYGIGENFRTLEYRDEHDGWRIYKIQYEEDDKGNLSYRYHPSCKVVYGTDEWQELFEAGKNGC